MANSNERYQSCIKIHGMRILPPLLDEEKRKQMRYFKELAIKTEDRLRWKKLTGSTDFSPAYIDTEDSSSMSDSVICSSEITSEEPTCNSHMFNDTTRSDILTMLNDKFMKNVVETPLLEISAIKNVPSNSCDESDIDKCLEKNADLPYTDRKNNNVDEDSDLSLDIKRKLSYTIDDTERNFDNDDIKKLPEQDDFNAATVNEVFIRSTTLDNNNCSCESNGDNKTIGSESTNIVHENKPENVATTPASLIRSNSYILDTPSPFLLAQIEQEKNETANKPEIIFVTPKKDINLHKTESYNRKRRSWDLANAKEKWSSIELDLHKHDLAVNKMPNKQKDRPIFNSLPSSAAQSPNSKMFNSEPPRAQASSPNKYLFKVFKSTTLDNKTELSPSKKIRTYKRILHKSPVSVHIFSKHHTTPTRSISQEKDLIPKKIQSKTKKTETPIRIKSAGCKLLQRTSNLNSTPIVIAPINRDSSPIVIPKKPDWLQCEESEEKIRKIIEKIQSEQSRQMDELIARQKQEQDVLMKSFVEQQTLLLSTLKETYLPNKTEITTTIELNKEISVINDRLKRSNSPELDSEILQSSENILIECKKLLQNQQTILLDSMNLSGSIQSFSPKSPDDTLTDTSLKSEQNGTDIEPVSTSTNDFSPDSLCTANLVNGGTPSQPNHNSAGKMRSLDNKIKNNQKESSVSRQLFPSKKQIWAATVLCAAARSYLTRRFMKTERVQNLIQTIQDTLLCAMELHHETAENIQPADVELHRRLIQQVTAACYSFHDLFFGISKSEQMSIIALDRDRQKEKLLRPPSSRSTTSLSSTTQRFLERKLRRKSAESMDSTPPSRCSSTRSSYSASEFRSRTKSLGLSDAMQCNTNKKTSPQNDMMRRAMSYGANKKPWR